MQKVISRSVALTLLLALMVCVNGNVMAMGTPLMLGAGQEFRFDLPLESGKSYAVNMALRTDLKNTAITMTLCHVRNNNEVAELHTSRHGLGDDGSWHILRIPEVHTPTSPGRFELIITADTEGRYYWKDLKVERSYTASADNQEYWSEKLATQGTFFTGLVVDARHLDVRRGMSPRIYSASGQLLYGGVLAGQDLVQDRGVVGYGSELTSELLQRIAIDSDYPYVAPLVVQAVGVADPAKTSVYISEDDTRRVLEAMVQYDFFARYAVIFLVN